MIQPWVLDNKMQEVLQDQIKIGQSKTSRQQISSRLWSITQIKVSDKKFWQGHRFSLCIHCYFDLEDMTMGCIVYMFTIEGLGVE